MKTFLIILAVIVVLIALILSISATITVIYDEKWITKIKVLWIEKDIKITEILSFILFPEEKAKQVKEENSAKKEKKKNAEKSSSEKEETAAPVTVIQSEKETASDNKQISVDASENSNVADKNVDENNEDATNKKPAQNKKPNYFKSLWDKEGIVGIMELVSNLLQTVSSAVGTLFRGFHIHSLYVKMIVGGYDAAEVALAYGTICKYYYPLKGIILNGMKVDNYDDVIMPDYIAPRNEYEFQFIGSISVGTLLKVVLSAAKTFIVNLIKK